MTETKVRQAGRRDACSPVPAQSPRRKNTSKAFGSFIKRLASLKSAAVGSESGSSTSRRAGEGALLRKRGHSQGRISNNFPPGTSIAFSIPQSSQSHDAIDKISVTESYHSKFDRNYPITPSNATISTSKYSHTGSGWSSPTPSERSLTTTLTTIQTTAPTTGYNPHPSFHHNPNSPPVLFSNPVSISAPSSQSQTYHSATANGLLTDNASVITLASSSRNRRRRSFDTDASVRALAPSSLFGASRESLPLSVLSANLETRAGDRASIHSRILDIGPFTGSIGGPSPLASPNRESSGFSLGSSSTANANGRSSRRSSAWGELLNDGEGDSRSLKSNVGSFKGSLRSGKGGTVEKSPLEMTERDATQSAGDSSVELNYSLNPETSGVTGTKEGRAENEKGMEKNDEEDEEKKKAAKGEEA